MKEKRSGLFGLFLLAAWMMFSIPVFASSYIGRVYLEIAPDGELSPGDTASGLEPEGSDEGYYVDEYEVSASDPNPRESYTYTITLEAESGYSFRSSTNVTVYGATEVTIQSVTSDTMKIKVKTYPYHVLDNPTNVNVDEEEEEGTWDSVDYAKTYSVVIYYTNSSGNEITTKKSVSGNSIDLSSYFSKYEDVSISVCAVKGTTDGDQFISNSDYIGEGEFIDDEYSDDEYVFDIPTAKSNGSTSSTITSTTTLTDGWSGSGDIWYYYDNGNKVTGWFSLGSEEWYLFDSAGTMLSGWQLVDGRWFYLNTIHDGTFGKMFYGWHNINEVWYYFSESSDGSFGAMYASQYSPDGHYLNASGARTD